MSRLTKFVWRLFFFGLISFVLIIIAISYGIFGYMPPMSELENPESAVASQLYAGDGTLIGKYYVVNRSTAKFSEISQNAFNALIATEDARFREHSGIDGQAVMRAVLLFGKRGGGSTITQQLAKNLFPRQNVSKLTLPFIKLKEWIMAVRLERNLTKDEIITLYLNTVPFGSNAYGIKNASMTFFSILPKDLTVDQAAVLIGMLKANTLYNPKRNPQRSLNRRNVVIDQMAKYNYITEKEAAEYKAQPLVLNYTPQSEQYGIAPYFKSTVEKFAKAWCKQHKKTNGEPYNLYTDGLKIYTTIDPILQKHAEDAVATHLKTLQASFSQINSIKTGKIWDKGVPKEVLTSAMQRSHRYKNLKEKGLSEKAILENFNTPTKMRIFTWENNKREKIVTMTPLDSIKYMRAVLQTGFIAMDPYDGEVKAWVGGASFKFFQYDHAAITTKRQVGSTIKPLLYCLAVENGYDPCGMVSTAPQKFKWQKQAYNAGGSRGGSMAMNRALALSINNASLYLLNQVGINTFIDFVHKTGISSEFEPVPSIALGVTDISVYEMLWSYTMFANSGISTQPIMVTRIEDRNGNLLENFLPQQREVIDEQTAFRMVKMMQGVVDEGTARRLRFRYGLNNEIAGKTGTTNNQSDAWFIGYTPEILAGAWVGADDRFLHFPSERLGQGAAAALPIWALFMQKALADPASGLSASAKFTPPDDFVFCQKDYFWGTGSSSGDGHNSSDSSGTPDLDFDNFGPHGEPIEIMPLPDEWKTEEKETP